MQACALGRIQNIIAGGASVRWVLVTGVADYLSALLTGLTREIFTRVMLFVK
jgi:hypothetical protein